MVNCTAVIAKPKYASAVLEIASAGAAGNDKAPATTDAKRPFQVLCKFKKLI